MTPELASVPAIDDGRSTGWRQGQPPVDTIVFLVNEISTRVAEAALRELGIGYERVALFLTRDLTAPWFAQCASVVSYGRRPSFSVFGQLRLVNYYLTASRRLRQLLASGRVTRIFVVNNDNLMTNHVFETAATNPNLHVMVLAEGIMNFQDIRMRNRDRWRTWLKPAMAATLRLRWRLPTGHLSGAFEPETRTVYTFATAGLAAPPEKVRPVRFTEVVPRVDPDPDAALIVMTGLHLWMSASAFAEFTERFLRWLLQLRYKRFYVKRHPRATDGPLVERLGAYPIVGENCSIEDMADTFPAATAIGFCSTGLVTLRLIRPDLRCLDFGADYYCDQAYFGDRSVETLLRATGVELVASEAFATATYVGVG